MTDWVTIVVLGVQTVVFLYASVKLRRMSELADKLANALSHIADEITEASRDMKRIQDEMTELEDLIRTALRE
jgi:urease gamma subunit